MNQKKLDEAMQTVSGAQGAGLALFRWKEYDSTVSYCLYHGETLVGRVEGVIDVTGLSSGSMFTRAFIAGERELPSCVYGYLQVSPNRDGGAEVYASCAQQGWGPLMYEIAMSEMGALYPDRESVSADARAVWNKFAARPDIKQTRIPGYDDVMYSGPQHDVSALYAENIRVMSELQTEFQIESDTFRRLIERVATDYFDRKYRGGAI